MSLAELIPADLMEILVHIRVHDATAYLVGGCVRDHLLGTTPKDFDIEVFGLSGYELDHVLRQFGTVSLVGESFGVYKVRTQAGHEYDFSLPRRDSKTGVGHKGFAVEVDPTLTPKEAAARRDYTINSIMYDPVYDVYYDFYHGRDDIKEGTLRPTSDHFAEDPLRVLRGMQFAGRFNMVPSVQLICVAHSIIDQYNTLSIERVWGEWYKWATLSRTPGTGLMFLEKTEWMRLYPALDGMVGVPQDPTYHPEGQVMVHCRHVCNAMATIAYREGITGEDRAVLMFAALLHDVGKATTTVLKEEPNKWRSPGHAAASVPLAEEFLRSIGCLARISERVIPLVREHMFPTWEEVTPRVVRRLMVRLEPASLRELLLVMEADHSGRPPLPPQMPEGAERLIAIQAALPPKIEPILKGRHLLETGRWQPGPEMGEFLKRAFEAQLDGEFTDIEGAKQWMLKTNT